MVKELGVELVGYFDALVRRRHSIGEPLHELLDAKVQSVLLFKSFLHDKARIDEKRTVKVNEHHTEELEMWVLANDTDGFRYPYLLRGLLSLDIRAKDHLVSELLANFLEIYDLRPWRFGGYLLAQVVANLLAVLIELVGLVLLTRESAVYSVDVRGEE